MKKSGRDDGAFDNLDDLAGRKYVFDNTKSNLRTFVDHQVSFVLPIWLGLDYCKTTMLRGTAVYLEFDLEGETNLEPKFLTDKKFFTIHGIRTKVPEHWLKIHSAGLVALDEHIRTSDNAIPGSEIVVAPKVLTLSHVHIKIDANDVKNRLTETKGYNSRLSQKELEDIITRCQSTGKKVQIIEQQPLLSTNSSTLGAEIHRKDPTFYIISVPIGWIIQDITALQTWNSSHKSEVIPFIKEPIAFPSIGTRIDFTDENDEERIAIVDDFNLMEDGKTIGALISLVGEENGYEPFFYSNLFAKTRETLFNPKIIRVTHHEDFDKIMTSYLEDARELIRRSLSRWSTFSISGLRILANEYTGDTNEDGTPVTKPRWIFPKDALGNKELNIVSFVGGQATIDGVQYSIVHKERENDRSKDKVIELSKITTTKCISRLVFNAAIGTAEGVVKGRKVQAFFSTANGVDISTRRIPLFGSVTPTDRVSINVTTFNTVLGFLSEGKDKSHPDQKVIMWTVVPEAFKNFYIFVAKQGQHDMFERKSASKIREMFESDEFPTLIEIYNFILYGLNKRNTTRNSKWSIHFTKYILGFEHDELISIEDAKEGV
jgi:hypothetical protein